jgi:MFS family permease
LTIRRPEDVGLTPDNAGPPLPHTAPPPAAWTLRQAVRTSALWLIAISGLFAWFASASFNLHLVPYLLGQGYSQEIAVLALSGLGLVSMVSTITSGLIADRVGVRPTYMVAFASAAIGIAFLLWLAAAWMVWVYVLFYGLAFGAYVTLQSSIWADYFGRGSLGAIRGVTMPVQLMGNAFGPFLAALAFDLTGSYVLPFAAFLLTSILGIGTMGLARKPRHAS